MRMEIIGAFCSHSFPNFGWQKFRAPQLTIPLHGVVLRSGIFSLKKWSKHCIQGHVMGKEPPPEVAHEGALHLLRSQVFVFSTKPPLPHPGPEKGKNQSFSLTLWTVAQSCLHKNFVGATCENF